MGDPPGDTAVYPINRPAGIITADCIKLTANHQLTSSQFLSFALRAPYVKNSLLEQTKGVAQQKLSLERFRQVPLPLPPLNEQSRILSKLESLLARSRRAKEALNAVPALLERFRQSVLASAFRGDLTADWRAQHPDVEPASQLLERIRAERRRRWEEAELEKMRSKSKVPKDSAWREKYEEPSLRTDPDSPAPHWFADLDALGWSAAPLELLADPVRGIPYGIVQTGDPHPSGVPTVRCGDLKDFNIELTNLKRVDPNVAGQYGRTRLAGGEVLLAIRGTVGGVAVASLEMAGMNISREVAMVPPLPDVNPRYLMYLLASPVGARILAGHTKGVAQSGVNLDDIRSFPVPIPSVEEQKEIVKHIDRALASLSSVNAAWRQAFERLDVLAQATLAKAFRGELVPQDPNDEPASVLLERIRAEREASDGSTPKRSRGRRPAA